MKAMFSYKYFNRVLKLPTFSQPFLKLINLNQKRSNCPLKAVLNFKSMFLSREFLYLGIN
jgi:hypothetical protein